MPTGPVRGRRREDLVSPAGTHTATAAPLAAFDIRLRPDQAARLAIRKGKPQ